MLATTNKDSAVIKARDIWTTIKSAGWDATIAKFKPDHDTAPKVDVTVGDLLASVKQYADLRQRTFLDYANCLRTIQPKYSGSDQPKAKASSLS